jgi:hypothetical protein
MKRLIVLLVVLVVVACGGGSDMTSDTQTRKSTRAYANADYENTVQKAFIAYYGRPADPGGLDFWYNRLSDASGDLSAIIDSFGSSTEFNTRFGGQDNSTLVNNIYQQLFNRASDSGGLTYYSGLIDSGASNLQKITLNVLYGAQNDDATKVTNKLTAAKYFTSVIAQGYTYPSETFGVNYLAMVDETSASIDTAKAYLDSHFGIGTSYNLKATGQTTSYAGFDDGAYKKGVASTYTRDANAIVTDSATGFMWQDDAIVTSATYTQAEAIEYCNVLGLGGYTDWRLPTAAEISMMTDYSASIPAMNSVFQNVVSEIAGMHLWSSTTTVGFTNYGWVMRDNVGGVEYTDYTHSYNARCVRGTAKPTTSLTRDATKEVVTDAATNLMWQDDSTAASITYAWTDAISFCENMAIGGYSDWRLPNITELRTIVDFSKQNNTISDTFTNTASSHYWSSTTSAYNTDSAWTIHFKLGYDHQPSKTMATNVRCVRDAS